MLITPTAASGGVYTVPTGKYLVITSLTIFPQSPGAGNLYIQLAQNSAARKYWIVPNAQPTHLTFGPGMLVAPGYSLKIYNKAGGAGAIRVHIYGYETN